MKLEDEVKVIFRLSLLPPLLLLFLLHHTQEITPLIHVTVKIQCNISHTYTHLIPCLQYELSSQSQSSTKLRWLNKAPSTDISEENSYSGIMFIDEKPSFSFMLCHSPLDALHLPPHPVDANVMRAYPLSNGIGFLVGPLTDLTVKRNIPSASYCRREPRVKLF